MKRESYVQRGAAYDFEDQPLSSESSGGTNCNGAMGLFECTKTSPLGNDDFVESMPLARNSVTLFVFGWQNVEPGPLSWVFPSLRAALEAVRTMRNAVRWCVVAGKEWTSVDAARAMGRVLVEQF